MIRKLSMQNSELSASLKELKKKKESTNSTASGRGKRSKLSEQELHILHFAKLFGVMYEPFVPPSALQAKRPDMSSLSTGRYESELSKVQGITVELYEVLPKDMHSDLKTSPNFRSLV
jgi:hypothetical protein